MKTIWILGHNLYGEFSSVFERKASANLEKLRDLALKTIKDIPILVIPKDYDKLDIKIDAFSYWIIKEIELM